MSTYSAAIVQLATPHIDVFAKYSMANVNEYCSRFGYSHFVQRIHSVEGMHINWSKIDLLRKAISEFPDKDYIVLFDADIVIQDFDKSIEYFISKYADQDTAVMFSADTPLRLALKPRPNAGFIILKNNEVGKRLVNRWIEASTTDGAKYNNTHPRNQLVYWNCVMPEFKDVQSVLPRKYFVKPLYILGKQFMPTSFLYHMTQSDKEARAEEMKRMANKVSANLDDFVKEVEGKLHSRKDYIILR